MDQRKYWIFASSEGTTSADEAFAKQPTLLGPYYGQDYGSIEEAEHVVKILRSTSPAVFYRIEEI